MTATETQTLIVHWIDGTQVSTGETFADLNPIDDSLLATVARGTDAEINSAVVAAHKQFSQYRSTTAGEREAWLLKAAELLEQRRTEFISVLVAEVGSPIAKAQFEVDASIGNLRAAAGLARRVCGATLPADTAGKLSITLRYPLGVVAAITPFNVPLLKGTRLTANALALGNTVVLLPSELAPVVADLLARLYADAGLPAGAFNVVHGHGEEIGDALTSHSLVRFVAFTGSTTVGKHIREICGRYGKKCTLELGGKNPLVIMSDANIPSAVEAAVRGLFVFQGQVCMASSRIYVQASVFEAFVGAYRGVAKSLAVGDLTDPKTLIGPIISPRQRERVRTHIDDAVTKGAGLLAGGGWTGNCVAPTLLTGVSDGMMVSSEETFGPVASIYSFESLDEAIELANATRYGLSAAIYTNSLEHAMRFIQEVDVGMVHVNSPTLNDEPHVPMGGVKDSGFGREGLEEDLYAMTELKWATIQHSQGSGR